MIDLFYYTINTFGVMFPPKVFCICVLSIKIKNKQTISMNIMDGK